MRTIHALCFFFLTLISLDCRAEIKHNPALATFIAHMHQQYQFDPEKLALLFASASIKDSIIKAISTPAEGLPWYKYREIFLTDDRINDGIKFWRANNLTLASVAQQYGVPAEIIVAIIGVETRYGKHTGHYRVIDALSTLGFAYPPRSQFFQSELENFLLLCREENIDPLEPTGSYAGAMGIPQFIPSSYRHYAVDHDGDQHRDIWKNPADAIASVANYFFQHHWQPGAAVAYPVQADGNAYLSKLDKGLKPDLTIQSLKSVQITAPESLAENTEVKLLAFEQENQTALWVGLHNFYVITRYNHSPMYAMAVYQLSQAILDHRQKQL